nr:LOW QUALITY PROTEIN: probable cytochrome P450 49a1 [Cherax quadricarinatus]
MLNALRTMVLPSSRYVMPWVASVFLRSCRGLSSIAGVAQSLTTTQSVTQPRPQSHIPGPKSWPLLGTMPATFTDPAYDSTRLPRLWQSYFKKYGTIFKLNFPGQGDVVFLCDPSDIQHLYKQMFENPRRPLFDSLRKIRINNGTKIFKAKELGILVEQGDSWWRVRKQVQVHALKSRTVAHYLPQVDQVAQEFVARSAGAGPQNELPGDFVEELLKWALESLCLVALNQRVGCFENSEEGMRIIKSSLTMLDAVGECEFGSQLWRYFTTSALRRMWRAHDYILKIVLEKMEQAKRNLEARSPEGSANLNILESLITTPGLSFEDVATFMIDLFFAGIDTTSMSTVFTMYNLARHPDKQARLQEEMDQVLGDGHQPLTVHHLSRLSYLKACVRENFRLLPTSSIVTRLPNKDVTLQGYRVKAGTHIYVSIKESGMLEEYFPRATEFLPERWLRDNPNRLQNQFASMPFSNGTRMCVGRRLAEQEIYVLLARLLLKYNLEYKYEDWDPVFTFIYKPDKPQNFTMTER